MVKDRVIRCVARLTGIRDEEIKQDAALDGDNLCMDSLDTIELVMMLEDEFEIAIDDAEAEACKTVADVVALVERVTK